MTKSSVRLGTKGSVSLSFNIFFSKTNYERKLGEYLAMSTLLKSLNIFLH